MYNEQVNHQYDNTQRMIKNIPLAILFFVLLSNALSAQTVFSVAGQTGISGSSNGTGAAASFNGPHGVACDGFGNIYIADRNNNKIRKVSAAGAVTTLAGSGNIGATDGTGASATFFEPWGIACDGSGNVYVADTKNYKIRKITPAGVVTTIAGTGASGTTNGPALAAEFAFPTGIAVAPGGIIYVAEFMTHTIRKIESGNVATLAGTSFLSGDVDGTGALARFDHPHSLAIAKDGSILVSDVFNNKIKKVSASGNVNTFAGNGIAGFANGVSTSSQFDFPLSIAVDSTGGIYVGDVNNNIIRKIASGTVSTFAGTQGTSGYLDGPALQAQFNSPSGLAFNFSDNAIWIGDEGNELIRKTTLTTVSTQILTLSANNPTYNYCLNDTVKITASPTGLQSYIFKDGTTVIATNTTGILKTTTLALGTHAITCTATGGGGSQYATASATTVTVNGAPAPATVTPPGPVTACYGNSTSLTASSGSAYLWSNGQTTQSIQVTSSGSYSVTVYNNGSCTQHSSNVQVSMLPQVIATISPSASQTICNGDSVLLTASAGASYLWSNGKTTQSIYVKVQGNYAVTVSNAQSCSATSSPVSVTINPIPTATITPGGNILLPQGQSQILSANTATTYQWSTGGNTQTISVNTAGAYWVRIKNMNGCWSNRDTVVVQMINSSTILTTQGSTTFCPGDSVVLHSAFATGNQWYRDNIAISGGVFQNYTAKQGGHYKVKVTQTGGSIIYSDSVLVTLKTLPTLLSSSSDSVCSGERVQLTVNVSAGASAKWFDAVTAGTLLGSGLNYLTPPINTSTDYFVELTASGCTNTQRSVVNAFVFPAINPNFTSTAPISTGGGYEVQFNPVNGSSYDYEWDFGDPNSTDNTSGSPTPSHTYSQQGKYTVTLVATSDMGCSDTIFKTVSVELETDLFLPNAFTPNNDGLNDVFRLRGSQIESSSMIIVSQWGNVIYRNDDARKGWDGTVSGRYVENATYTYMVKVKKRDEPEKILKGNISLIR